MWKLASCITTRIRGFLEPLIPCFLTQIWQKCEHQWDVLSEKWASCTSLTVLHFYIFCFVAYLHSKFWKKNNLTGCFSSVCWRVFISDHPSYTVLPPKASAAQGFKASEPFNRQEWNHQGSWLWFGSGIWRTCKSLHAWGLWLNKLLHYMIGWYSGGSNNYRLNILTVVCDFFSSCRQIPC